MTDHAIETRLSRLESGQTDLQALLADLPAWRQEMQEAFRESWRRGEELDRRFQETDRMIKDLQQETRKLGKQIGGLGQKFGGFTEGLAIPSMERRLAERFGTTGFVVRPRIRVGDEELEVDALAYSSGAAGTVCVVDVESRLRDQGIDQILRALENFPRFFPEHRGKKLIGVLAAVDANKELEQRVLREGLVLARIRDDVFELRMPEGHEPRAFPNPPASDA